MKGITQVSEHTFEIGGSGAAPVAVEIGGPVVQSVTAPPIMVPAPVAPVAVQPAASGRPLTARQLLTQLRARLREVNRELVTKKALEQERAQLQRLIKAATTELDNVRRLRAAG